MTVSQTGRGHSLSVSMLSSSSGLAVIRRRPHLQVQPRHRPQAWSSCLRLRLCRQSLTSLYTSRVSSRSAATLDPMSM